MTWLDLSNLKYQELINLVLDELVEAVGAEQAVLGIPSTLPLPVGGRVRPIASLWEQMPLEARASLDAMQRVGADEVRTCTAVQTSGENQASHLLAICLPIRHVGGSIASTSGHQWKQVALVVLTSQMPFPKNKVWEAEAIAQQLTIPLEHLYNFYHPQSRESDAKALKLLSTLAEFNVFQQDEQALLENVCNVLKERLHAVRALVMFPDEEGNLRPRASAGLPIQRIECSTLPAGKSIAHIAMEERRPIYLPDTSKEERFLPKPFNIPALIVAPLLTKDKVLGVITVDGAYPHAFSQSDVDLVSTLALYLASAIENLRIYRSLREQHEQLRRLEQKRSEIIENISHELRTPLAIIKGHVEILLEDARRLSNLPPDFGRNLEVVLTKIEDLERLTRDIIIAFNNQEREFHPAEVDLCHLAKQAVTTHQARAKRKNITLKVMPCPQALQPVWGDRFQLEEACDSLIDNALKYSPPQTTITIALKALPNFARCSITDEGPGIPEGEREKVFERFYQIESAPNRAYGGLGLGLALVKAIIEETHHGRIRIETPKSGRGVTFVIDLPYARS